MKSALAFAGTGFFEARLRKSSGRFAESVALSEAVDQKKAADIPWPDPLPADGGEGARCQSRTGEIAGPVLLQMLLTSDASAGTRTPAGATPRCCASRCRNK